MLNVEQGKFLSVPGDEGEGRIKKKHVYKTHWFSLTMKHKHIKPILKDFNKYGNIIFYKSLAPFQYEVMHSLWSFSFSPKNRFNNIVLFERFHAGWLLQCYIFSTLKYNLNLMLLWESSTSLFASDLQL